MKKMKYFIFSIICLFSCSIVFAENEVIIKSITPVYDENSSIVVTNENNNHKVIFNDKNQSIQYKIIIENTSGYELSVSKIDSTTPSKDFLIQEISGISVDDVLESNSEKEFTISLFTAESDLKDLNINDELITLISFKKDVKNPFTSSKDLIIILVVSTMITIISIIFIKKTKLKKYVMALIALFSLIPTIKANDIIDIQVKINAIFIDSRIDVSNLNNNSAIFFGDSVAYGHSTNGKGFGYYVNEIAGFSRFTNAAVNSATINTNTQGTNNIIQQMQNNKNSSYDYVIIEGGYGDLRDTPPLGALTDSYKTYEFDTNTFAGAVEYALYQATTFWPNAKIGFIISYDTPNSNYGVRPDHNATKKYWDIVKAACDKWNVEYLDFFEGYTIYNGETKSYSELFEVTKTTYLANDFIHPTATGYEFIAPFIAKWMNSLKTYNKDFEIITEEETSDGIKIVNSFSDLIFTNNVTAPGAGLGTNVPTWSDTQVTGRASAVNYLVKVNGGEKIGLSSLVTNVSYAIVEYDINKTVININNIPGKGELHRAWLSADVTLQTTTKYILVSFKNGDGSTSFTNEQLALLPTYIVFK